MDLNNMKVPSWDEIFLRFCYITAMRSKDVSTKIGTVIVKDKTLVSHGWNGFPRGVNDNDKERNLDRDLKLMYTCHSEFNAVVNCARNGISTLGTILYTLGQPCCSCAATIIQSGAKSVVIHKQWMDAAQEFYKTRWAESKKVAKQMFKEARVEVREVDCVLNLSILLDRKLVNV